jgi:hypothetical protein
MKILIIFLIIKARAQAPRLEHHEPAGSSPSSVSSSYFSPPWLGAVKIFSPTNLFAFPITLPSSRPFTPVEPGYGVVLYEDDYLLLPHAADLRMDPALRPRPVSSVVFVYLGNAYNSNHSIERRHIYSPSVFRCDIRSTHQSEYVYRFYVYGGIFDNPPG